MTTHVYLNDTAVAAILAINIDAADYDHARIAAALEPLVAAAPAMRKWDGDGEWDAVEEACAAAGRIVQYVKFPAGRDPWMTVQNSIDRLRKMQAVHRSNVLLGRLGNFPGYKLNVRLWGAADRIQVWQEDLSTDLTVPILILNNDVTRREIEIAILAWNAGHNRGLNEGTTDIQQRLRDLLGIDQTD